MSAKSKVMFEEDFVFQGQGPSFISLLVDEFANSRNYYRYDLSNQINAMRAEIAQNEQDTLAIFCTVDDRTVFVELLHGVTTQPFCWCSFISDFQISDFNFCSIKIYIL